MFWSTGSQWTDDTKPGRGRVDAQAVVWFDEFSA
jgi:hypothetical protein